MRFPIALLLSATLALPAFAVRKLRAVKAGEGPAKAAKPAKAASGKTKRTASSPADVTVGPEHAGKRVGLRVGQVLAVKLPGDASSGLDWFLADIDGTAVAPAKEPVKESKAKAEGEGKPEKADEAKPEKAPAGGPVLLRAVEEGSAEVSLEYRRPWDKEPEKTYSVTVDVKPGKAPPKTASEPD